MKRTVLWLALACAVLAGPAYAQNLGSVVGGPAANQSGMAGGVCLTSPVALTNGQQAGLLIDCNTHALIVSSSGGGAGNVTITGPLGSKVSAQSVSVVVASDQGNVPTTVSSIVNALGITPTDRTITSASGSSQQIMAANASRHSLLVQNTGNAICGVNPTGGTAAIGGAGTITLSPGGSYSPRIPSLSAVTVICTAAQPIYANEN